MASRESKRRLEAAVGERVKLRQGLVEGRRGRRKVEAGGKENYRGKKRGDEKEKARRRKDRKRVGCRKAAGEGEDGRRDAALVSQRMGAKTVLDKEKTQPSF